MRNRWPDFRFDQNDQLVWWTGTLTPIQKAYVIKVFWMPQVPEKPYVVLANPLLCPRGDGDFTKIPHLLYNEEKPELSGLCLFDPDGNEWTNRRLIADTTMPWASQWLYHYEFWLEGVAWTGASVGFESVAEARAAALYRQARELAENAPADAGMAEG